MRLLNSWRLPSSASLPRHAGSASLQEGLEVESELFRVSRFALPNDQHPPAHELKLGFYPSVSRHIALELLVPEILARLWGGRFSAPVMTMPEATVDKYYGPPPGENKVWRAWQLTHVQSKAIAERMGHSANDYFRQRILALNPSHQP